MNEEPKKWWVDPPPRYSRDGDVMVLTKTETFPGAATVAIVKNHWGNAEEHAHIIAASRDLLAACEMAITDSASTGNAYRLTPKTLKMLTAATAKAKGENHE